MKNLTILTLFAMLVTGCGSPNPDPLPKMETVYSIRGGGGASTTAGPGATVGEGWGTLKGVFVFGGDPPAPKSLSTGGKDPTVCNPQKIFDESLVVDQTTRGIKNIVVYARKVSRVHEDAAKPDGEQVFDQKQCIFLDHVLPVVAGVPVVIKNSDPVGHNTNVAPPGDTPSNNLIPGGDQIQHLFKRVQAEPVAVSCTIHPWMKSYILPRKDTYVAVTKPDGSFEIPNLPAGEKVEFQFWHERQPKLEAKPEWKQGRATFTIPKDGVEDLGQIQVSPSLLQ